MPTKTFNRTEELTDKIGYPDDAEDEADLQAVLEQANGQLQTLVGRTFEEDKRVRKVRGTDTFTSDLVNEFDLKMAPILEFDELLLDRHEVVDSSNYTVDKQSGTVTVDQGFVDDEMYEGQELRLSYVPVQFKQIELWEAVKISKNQELIQLEDSEQAQLYNNAKVQAKTLVNQVNRLSGSGTATDGDVRRGTK